MNTQVMGRPLDVEGSVEQGGITDGGFVLKANAKLSNDFVVTEGNTTLTVEKEPGQANIDISGGKLNELKVDNFKYKVNTQLRGKPLDVEGTVQQGGISDGGFVLKADAKLTNDFVTTEGQTTLTVEKEPGQANIDISGGKLNELKVDNFKYKVNTQLRGKPLDVEGTIQQGGISDGGFVLKADAKLTNDYIVTEGQTTLTVEKEPGQANIDISGGKLNELKVDQFKYKVNTTLKGSPLDVEGTVQQGGISDGGFVLKADAKLSNDFTITEGVTTLTVEKEPGQATIDISGGKLNELKVDQFKYKVNTQLRGKPLDVEGTIHTGGISDGGFVLQADAKLTNDYVVTEGQTTLTVEKEPGQAIVDISGGKLNELKVDNFKYKVNTQLRGKPLDVEGTIQTGGITDGGFVVKADAKLTNDFVTTEGQTTLTVEKEPGQANIDISGGKLNELKVDNFKYKVNTILKGSPLDVEGTIQQGGISDGGFVLKADAKLSNDFTITEGNTTLTVEKEPGQATIDISGGKLNELKVDSFKYKVNTQLNGKPLDLAGTIHEGGISDGGFVLKADARLTSDYTFKLGGSELTAVAETGQAIIDVSGGALNELKIDGMEYRAKTKAGNKDVGIKGTVETGGITQGGFVLKADAKLESDFQTSMAGVDLTILAEPGVGKVDISNGTLNELKVENFKYEASTTLAGNDLDLEGNIIEGGLSAGSFSFKADSKLKKNFIHSGSTTTLNIHSEPGRLIVDFSGGSLNELKVDGFEFDVQTKLLGKDLSLEGKINTGGISGGTFQLNAEAGLKDDFIFDGETGFTVFKEGPKAVLDVTQAGLNELTINNLKYEFHTKMMGKPVGVDGTVETGGITSSGVTLKADAKLSNPVTVTLGKTEATLVSGTGDIDVSNTSLNRLGITGLEFKVKTTIAGKQLNLGGTVEEGAYEGGQFTLKAWAALEPPAIKFKVGPADVTLNSGEAFVDIQNSALNEAGIRNVDFDVEFPFFGMQVKVKGTIPNGSVKDSGVSLTAEATLKTSMGAKSSSGIWSFLVTDGATVGVEVVDNELVHFGCDLPFNVVAGGVVLMGQLKDADIDISAFTFSGDLDLGLAAPFSFPRSGDKPPGVQLTVLPGTSVKASVQANALTSAEVSLKFLVNAKGAIASGDVNGTWDLDSDEFSGDGKFTLVNDYELGGGSGDDKEFAGWKLGIAGGSGVDVKFAANKLEETSINVDLYLKKGGDKLCSGNLNGTYKFGDEGGYSGGASIKLDKEVQIAQVSRFTAFLAPETGGSVTFADSEVQGGTLDFTVLVKDGGKPAVKVSFNGNYTPGVGVSGSGAIQVLNDVLIGKGGDFSVYLGQGSGGTLAVTDNEPGAVSGTLKIKVAKGANKFASGEFTVDYDFSQGDSASVNAEGSVSIDASLELGTAAGYKFTLKSGSGVSAKVTDNDLDWLDGKLGLMIGDPNDLIDIEIQGHYDHGSEPMFDGVGRGKFVAEKSVGTYFGYEFVIKPGTTNAEIKLASSALEYVSGAVELDMRKAGGTINVHLNGKYTKDGNNFTGGGSCDIQDPIKISAGEFEFEIEAGSGLEFKITNNKLDFIKGQLKGKVNWGGPFLEIDCKVTYRNIGDGEIDVDGKCKITGTKKIFGPVGENAYAFWLIPSDGYTCEVLVEKNDLKKVSAEVSFKITDKGGDLIVGSANGTWLKSTGKYSGSGALHLGRDLDFPLPAAGKLVFKKGSGGDATVENSELRRLGGTLNVDIHDGDGLLATLGAEGEYDAVKNEIIKADGHATLVRPWTLMGGKVIVSNVSGSAKVRKNKLRELKGKGHISLPEWNVEGEFTNLEWSDLTGQDVYKGSGWLQIVMLDGDLTGRVTVEEFQYGGGPTKFKVKGDVSYTMKDYIKGTVGLEVDEKLDPKLEGNLDIVGTLYPGRDLIKQKMTLVPQIGVTVYGVTLSAGCDAGLIVSLKPVKITGSAGFKNFFPLRMNTPTFNVGAEITAGLNLEAFVAPYLALSIGVTGLGAGIKLQGKASLNVPVDVSAGAKIWGDGDKFGGELDVKAAVKPSVTLSFMPVLFAQAGPMSAEHPLEDLQKTYEFPDLYVFEWGKVYKFGDEGQQEVAQGAPGAQETGGSSTQAALAAEAPEQVATGTSGPGTTNERPSIGEEKAGESDGGEKSDMQQKMAEIKEYATNLGKLAKLVGFVIDIISIGALLSFLGPVGWLVAAVIALIKIGGPGAILEGFEALGWFIGKLAAWVWSLMPDWFKNAWAEIKRLVSMGAAGAAAEVSKAIKAWGRGFSAPWGDIFAPLIDWAAEQATAFIMAFEGFSFSPWGFIKLILKLTMAAVSGAEALVSALKDVIDNVVKLVRHLVTSGKIVATCTDPDDWGKNPWYWKFDVPGVCNISGSGDDAVNWAIGNLAAKGLRDIFGCTPNTNLSSDWGFDYR